MKKFVLCLVLASMTVALRSGHTQDKSLKKIRWGVTSLSASQWIPWIAKDAKIYEKHGLDTELILLRGSGQSSQAIVGGSIFAAPVTLATVMNADLSGADLVTVAHTVAGVQSKLLVKPEIKRPEDLRGKRLAISTFGSLGDFLNRHIIKKYGMEPGRDVILITIGNTPERIQALVSGGVDAADLNYPADAQAERLGFKVLWDAKQEVSYPSMSVVTRRKSTFLLMNKYPYSAGHLMAVTYRKVSEMAELTDSEVLEIWQLCIHAQRLLKECVKAQGFNIGWNLGKSAGAGVHDHLHLHIVPRWTGDANFMTVVGGVRIIPEGLMPLYDRLKAVQEQIGQSIR